MSRDASMKSRSNSSMKVDDPNPKENQSQQSDYNISEHESEYIPLSQLELQEDEEDKKLENSDDSSESISCNSDIHGEGDDSHHEAEYDEDLNKAKELRDISDLNEKETRDLIKSFYEANLSEVDVLHKNIKGLSKATVYRIYHKLRTSGTVDRKPGSGRKSKIQDDVFEQIREQLKADNTLSSTEIRQKLDAQGIKVSDSSIRRALKIRKYAYKKPNIETMILNAAQKKTRKEFCQNYIDSDYSKMIFIDECVFKGGKQRSRKWWSDEENYRISAIKPKCKVNVWGGISLNWNISLRFFNENMNTDLYLDILKEKKSEMRNLWGKGFILMRDNAPSHVSDKTAEYMKLTKMKEWKDWPPYSPDLNPIENIWGIIKTQLMKKEINKRSELIKLSKKNTIV